MLKPFDAIMRAGIRRRRRSRSRFNASARMSFTSELFPEPLTPVTQTNAPSGISTVTFFRLLCRAPTMRNLPPALSGSCATVDVCFDFGPRPSAEPVASGSVEAGRSIDASLLRVSQSSAAPVKNWPVTLRWRLRDFLQRADRHHFAAAHAGAGAEIDNRVGRPHRVFIMLDDDDRVPLVAQLPQGVEQLLIIARMQSDRRLVENVQHADQPAADLAGQADALRFAAGKRRGRAIERQIFQPHVDQETRAGREFPSALPRQFFGRWRRVQVRRRTPRHR